MFSVLTKDEYIAICELCNHLFKWFPNFRKIRYVLNNDTKNIKDFKKRYNIIGKSIYSLKDIDKMLRYIINNQKNISTRIVYINDADNKKFVNKMNLELEEFMVFYKSPNKRSNKLTAKRHIQSVPITKLKDDSECIGIMKHMLLLFRKYNKKKNMISYSGFPY